MYIRRESPCLLKV